MTGQNWEIQKVPSFAAEIGSVLGYSATSLTFGASPNIAVGVTISMTTDANKLFNSGSHIVVGSPTDSAQFFRGISSAYNSSTGAISIFVTDVGADATGTIATWVLWAQDGPSTTSLMVLTSTTSRNPSSSSVGDTISFAVTTTSFWSALIDQRYSILVYSASDPSFNFSGLGHTDPTSSDILVNIFSKNGSGAKTDWIIQLLTSPLGINGTKGAGLVCPVHSLVFY